MFDLRYYQTESISAIRSEWESVQSTALIAATGCGKTEIYLKLASECDGRALVLVHRDYLITQPINRLAAHGFDNVAIEKADQVSEVGYRRAKIVFASVQSIGPKSQSDRLASFDPNDFSVLIIDEGHRATSPSYRSVINHFKSNPRCKILILTATPKRRDGVALGNVADSVAYTYGPSRGMDEGWIVSTQFFRRDVSSLDFSHVKMKGADLDPDQVEELMKQEGPLHEVCSSLCDFYGPTIVFTPTVQMGHLYATMINQRYRPGKAMMIDQDTEDDIREDAGKMLADGKLDYLLNFGIFTEGYDVPHLQRVVWAAPTASLVRYCQGTGRVFRPHPEVKGQLTGGRDESERRVAAIASSLKPVGEVVTYYPQNCKHQLCDPIDILGGDDLPPDVSKAARMVQDETSKLAGGSSTDEDIETAKCFVEFRSLLDQRLKELRANAKYDDHQFNPMSGMNNGTNAKAKPKGSPQEIDASWGEGQIASPAQQGWFRYQKVPADQINKLTKWRACVVRDLFEMGVSLETALAYKKRQALAVRDSMKAKQGAKV